MANNTADLDWVDCNALRRDAETGGNRKRERQRNSVNDNEWRPTGLLLIESDGTETRVSDSPFGVLFFADEISRSGSDDEPGGKAASEAEKKAKAEAEQRAKEEAERKAKEEAEARAKAEAAAKAAAAKALAEKKAKEEAEAKAKKDAEARAKAEAEAKAKAEEEARKKAEAKARAEAEAKAKAEAERKAKEKAEAAAKAAAEKKAKEAAEAKAKAEAERKAKQEAEAKAKALAEKKAKQEAEKKAREDAERKAKQEAERKAKEEAEKKAKKEAEAKAAAEAKAKKEAEAKAKKVAEAKVKAAAEAKAKKEAEAKAKAAAEAKAKKEAEAKAKAEAEEKAREAAEAKAQAEAEAKARAAAKVDLDKTFRRLIRESGPISLAQYMGESNARYYASRDPLGEEGDFITAPEISQMFGELVGLWLADVWVKMGASDNIHYVELGPGRGTLAKDVLKTAGKYGFKPQIHFVEGSIELRKVQRQAVPSVRFHNDLSTLPDDRPLLIVANEFFDALPIHQLVRSADGWHERMVGLEGDKFAFVAGDKPMDSIVPSSWSTAPQGSMIETSPAAATIMTEISQRLANQGGAALIIDYGPTELRAGSTLQALKDHKKVDPFDHPGEADFTAHVDFEMLQKVAETNGAEVMGLQMQGEWLRQLHIDTRLEALKRQSPNMADTLQRQYNRLVQDDQMGVLFKVLGVCGRRWPRGEGFD